MGQMEGWVQWNFVPFVDLARSLDQPSWVQQIAITNLVGNVLFFVPWGIMVALRFPGARWLALLATTAAVSLGVETSHVIAISGRIEDDRFLPEHLVRLDGGPDFYAPAAVIAPDGRHLLLGWIPEDPPDEASSTRDWAGALTLPRVISLRPEGGLT